MPQFKTREMSKPEPIIDLKALEEAGDTIGQTNTEDGAVVLSPVRRKAYEKRYIAHIITSTFMVCDYDNIPDKKGDEK